MFPPPPFFFEIPKENNKNTCFFGEFCNFHLFSVKDLAAKELGFLHLSAGELLREERSRSGSPLAKEIEDELWEVITMEMVR